MAQIANLLVDVSNKRIRFGQCRQRDQDPFQSILVNIRTILFIAN